MKNFFLVLYLFTGFVPILNAADRSSTQFLYLQILNFLFIIYFFSFSKENKNEFFKNFISLPFISLFLFASWSILSITVSVNKVESLKNVSYILTYVTAFPIIYYLFKSKKNVKIFFLNIVTFVLSVEVFAVVFPALFDLVNFGKISFRSASYSGVTGNINIAAFSILIKLPLIIYNFYDTKKIRWFIFNFLILFFSIFSVFSILQTRGAILGVFLMLSLIIIKLLFRFISKRLNFKDYIKLNILILLSLVGNILISTNQFSIFSFNKENGLVERLETIGSSVDESKNSRLRYWEQSLDAGINNPLFGVGTGNWKLLGIEADIKNLSNYVVPYHTHNDFLEIFAETGILGIIFYILFLLPIFLITLNLSFKKKTPDIFFYLMLCFLLYLLDASLNFPFARPIQQIWIITILIFILIQFKQEFNLELNINFLRKNSNYLIGLILLILSPLTLYSSIRNFKSNQQQYKLLSEFNLNLFSTPIDKVEAYESDYPNLSETTIPLITFKGIYNLRNQNVEKAIKYFHKGMKINPYLYINETYLGYAYSLLNKKDSSLYYSRLAFTKYPNNINHFANYVISLSLIKDSLEIKNAYNKINEKYSNSDVDKIYYLALSSLLDKDETRSFLDETSKNILRSDETDELTRINYYILNFGKAKIIEADILYQQGLKNFEQNNFLDAAQNFEKAAEINPLELPYFENAANAYMQISMLDEALKNINYVIENSDKPNGKALYIKALIFLEKGEIITTCKLLDESEKAGFRGARNLKSSYCK